MFTELILRLYPIPDTAVAARAVFPDIESAGRAAVSMIRSGMQIGRVELVDDRTVEAVNAYDTEYAVAPTFFLEFSGSEAAVEHDLAKAREISDLRDARHSNPRATRPSGRNCGRPATKPTSP